MVSRSLLANFSGLEMSIISCALQERGNASQGRQPFPAAPGSYAPRVLSVNRVTASPSLEADCSETPLYAFLLAGVGDWEARWGDRPENVKKQTKPEPQMTEQNPTTFSLVVGERKNPQHLCGNFPNIVIISACSWPWEHFQRNQYSGKPFVFQKGHYSKAINQKTLKLSNFRGERMEEGNVRACACARRREYGSRGDVRGRRGRPGGSGQCVDGRSC